mmetsp:Transcript_19410/g.35118  ORF Transcript_19410/g.35118 Transcript_19410/m.35118 type:complete len:96 (+) Transcript_19410:254-541(+)
MRETNPMGTTAMGPEESARGCLIACGRNGVIMGGVVVRQRKTFENNDFDPRRRDRGEVGNNCPSSLAERADAPLHCVDNFCCPLSARPPKPDKPE